jgi:uncharacterized repeat protein (TIGR04076 family)
MSEKFYTKITHKITITVKEVQGVCSAGLKVGDKIVVKVPRIDVRETDNICINGLNSLIPYLRQWSTEPFPPNARSIVCCSDPGPQNGGLGHVLFEIKSEKIGG